MELFWSHKRTSSKQRRLNFLVSGHLSDCAFVVIEIDPNNPEKKYEKQFKCHKIILASASEVFERMFFSDFYAEERIEIVDVSAASFAILLNYIYTSEFCTEYLSLLRINELLYLGSKYMIQDFIDCIHESLRQRTWNLDEILPILELSCLYEDLTLMLLSYQHIQDNAANLLKHETFFNLNIKNLKRVMVLLSTNTNLTRHQMVFAVVRYGTENDLAEIEPNSPKELVEASEVYKTIRDYVQTNRQPTDYESFS